MRPWGTTHLEAVTVRFVDRSSVLIVSSMYVNFSDLTYGSIYGT